MPCYHNINLLLCSRDTYHQLGTYYTRTGFELEDLCAILFVNFLSPKLKRLLLPAAPHNQWTGK